MEDMTTYEEKLEWTDFQTIGYKLVKQYYTVLTNAPEHLWRFYDERAQYCRVDEYGVQTVATGRPQLRQLFANDHPSSPSVIMLRVWSVNVIQCGSTDDRMLVLVTADEFVQTFVAELTSPWSWTLVASVVRHCPTAAAAATTDATAAATAKAAADATADAAAAATDNAANAVTAVTAETRRVRQ